MKKCPKETIVLITEVTFKIFKTLEKLSQSSLYSEVKSDIEETLDKIDKLKEYGLKTQE